MNKVQFVSLIRSEVVESAVDSVVSNLINPPGRKPADSLVRLSRWFNSLDENSKSIVIEIVRESAETSVFGFFCVLDGVRAIEAQDKGDLKLYYEKAGSAVLLNSEEGDEDYLHDIFNEEL